jgi:aldehyde dehydrogenase (NAD+)
VDVSARWIAPTIVSGVTPDSALMQEEIFGTHAVHV